MKRNKNCFYICELANQLSFICVHKLKLVENLFPDQMHLCYLCFFVIKETFYFGRLNVNELTSKTSFLFLSKNTIANM